MVRSITWTMVAAEVVVTFTVDGASSRRLCCQGG